MTMDSNVVRNVAAGEFKAKCLALLDEVRDCGSELVVTKRGQPVARIVPMERSAAGRPSLAHYVRFTGDVVSPIEADWEAMK